VNLLAGVLVVGLVSAGASLAWLAGGPPQRSWAFWTPVRVLVVGYLILEGLGAAALAASGEAINGPLLIGCGFVAIGIGAYLVRRAVGPPSIPDSAIAGTIRRPIVLALVAVGLAMYIWLAVDHGIPLLGNQAQSARLGWAGARLDLFRWLVPPAALLCLGFALATRRRDVAIVAAGALAAVAGVEVAFASRALPLELGLAALLIALWAGRRVGRRGWILVAAAAGLVFFGVLFARIAPGGGFTGPMDALSFAVNRAVDRVVLIHPRTVDVIVEVYPADSPYIAGASYVRWLDYLRGVEPPPPLGRELFERLFPDEPPGGFASPGVLGEAYANFGPVWALVVMGALGAIAALIGNWLSAARPDAATLTLAALIVVALLRTYATSLNGFLLTVAAALGWWLLVDSGAVGRLLASVRALPQLPSGGR
jgi:hypothetical protein